MDSVNKTKNTRASKNFTHGTSKQSEKTGNFNERSVQPKDTNITNRGDLSSRLTELQNQNRKVTVNKGVDTRSSIDILQYKSKEDYFNLNGRITEQGIVYSKLFMFFKKLFKLFGITIYKSYDNLYWCRHLSFAVMKGYLKKEDIEKVESKDDFLELINNMQNIPGIEQSLAENETVLKYLEGKHKDFITVELFTRIKGYIIPSCPEPDAILKLAEILQKRFLGIASSISIDKKLELEKAQIVVSEICKLAQDLEKELLWSDQEEIYDRILEQLNILDNIKLGSNVDSGSSFLVSSLSDNTRIQKEEASKLANLQRLADSFKQHGYNKEHKIITSILKKDHITDKDSRLLFDNTISPLNVRSFIYGFYIKEQGKQIATNVYELNNEKSHVVACSESSFSEALYHLCTIESKSLEPTERSFIIESPVHDMQLTIKSDGDKRHIIFYDPNKTIIFQEVELSSADMAKDIKITDFLSPYFRSRYKFTSHKNTSTDKLSDEVKIIIQENM